jgi:hypothetical protein
MEGHASVEGKCVKWTARIVPFSLIAKKCKLHINLNTRKPAALGKLFSFDLFHGRNTITGGPGILGFHKVFSLHLCGGCRLYSRFDVTNITLRQRNLFALNFLKKI